MVFSRSAITSKTLLQRFTTPSSHLPRQIVSTRNICKRNVALLCKGKIERSMSNQFCSEISRMFSISHSHISSWFSGSRKEADCKCKPNGVKSVAVDDETVFPNCDRYKKSVPLIQQRRRYFCGVRRIELDSGSSLGPSTRHSLFDTMSQPLTVCVEGNIGSGKTTFLKHFKKFPEVCVLDEPISKWRDCQGYNLLDLMYRDPRKWSLCFQSYVQLTMLDLHTKPIVQPIKMMERSIFSAQYCFVKNMRDEGLMDDAQYTVLSEWFNFATTNLPLKLDLIVYLRTDPEVAHKRINQRGRSEENSIKLEYLQSIHKLHEDWLIHGQKLLPCPVLTIDANLELEDMAPNYLLCEKQMFQNATVANC